MKVEKFTAEFLSKINKVHKSATNTFGELPVEVRGLLSNQGITNIRTSDKKVSVSKLKM